MNASRWQKIEEGVAVASEMRDGNRAAWLDGFCAGDGELKAEIESLLVFENESESFLETSLAPIAARILPDDEANLAGQQFGHYRIIREIGAGGMGAVFLAERSDGEFDQNVAVKIVRQAIAEREMLERFRRERQILANLNHPNIAKLLDGGVSADGLPYIVMEFVAGETITRFAADLTVEEKLKLFLKVCAGVAFAHRNLTIHRDIKPSNILVTDDGEPKLLDFGLAKLLDESLADETQTQTNFRALTPAYASPEQMRGERQINVASDIYSLGVVLFELLTGARPFDFERKSLNEILQTIDATEPPPPSSKSKVQSLKSKVENEKSNPKSKIQNLKSLKGDLDNIVLLALRREPERRYHSVVEFSQDIENYLNGLPVSARPNTFGYRASKFIRRNRVAFAAAALVTLSLIGASIYSFRQAQIAKRESARAETVNQFLQGILVASNPDTNLSRKNGHDTTVKELLDDASKRLETGDLSGQLETKAELQRIVGTSYLTQGEYDLAEKNLNRALALQIQIYGEDNPETLKTMVTVGDLLMQKGSHAEADKFYNQRLSILRREQKTGAIAADDLFSALHDYALLKRAQGDSKTAETLLREALDLRPQLSAEMKSTVSIADSILALTLADQGKFDEAEKIARAKSAEVRANSNIETPEFAGSLTFLGSILSEKGEYDEAENYLSQAEAIYRKLFRQTYLALGDNLRLQAQTLYFQDKLPEATAKIDETLEIYRNGTSAQYVNYPTALVIQGLILNKQGKQSEAEKILREAVRIRAENLPAGNFMRALADGALGECLAAQKRFAEAEPILLESFQDLKNSQGAGNPRTLLAQRRLGKLYRDWNKPELAARYADLPGAR